MSAYMTAVIVCASVTALVGIIMPGDGATARYIKYISGLVMLCVIASPLFELLGEGTLRLPDIDAFETYTYEFDIRESIIERTESSLSVTLADDIADAFMIDRGDIDASVMLDAGSYDDVKIASVTVTLRGRAVWTDAFALTEYIKNTYNCEAGIRYE